MSAQDDDVQAYAVGVVLALLAFVIAAVLGLVLYQHAHKPRPDAVASAAATALVPRIYFDVGQDSLPAGADEVLDRVAAAARENSLTRVVISGFHDASGDAVANAALARRRTQRVQHALEANGVSAAQLELSQPALATGGSDPREARRVELTLAPGP